MYFNAFYLETWQFGKFNWFWFVATEYRETVLQIIPKQVSVNVYPCEMLRAGWNEKQYQEARWYPNFTFSKRLYLPSHMHSICQSLH